MARLNLNTLWLWPLNALLVVLLMSFQDPFRVAVAAFLLSAHGPIWRGLHGLEPRPAHQGDLNISA